MKTKHLSFFILFIVSGLFLYLLFKPVIHKPNEYFFSQTVDPVKSYYNFSWLLKNDVSIKHQGINYPYGEHVSYINSHPIYVYLFKGVNKFIYPVRDSGTGILNLVMIFSLFISILLLYLILRHYALPGWYSVIMAIILGLLTPQFTRIQGHFEMANAFHIPLYWYLLIQWKKGRSRWLWSIALIIAGLIGGFTSAYFAAMFTIFLLSVFIVDFLINRKNLSSWLPAGLLLFTIAIIPVVAVKGFVTVTDWVSDRPDNPWGFFIFHSNIFSIFLPLKTNLIKILKNIIDLNIQYEGSAYVGLPATILAVSVAFLFIYKLAGQHIISLSLFFQNRELNRFLIAAVIVLLFSMCIPFKYGFDFIPDIIPPLKQFRCLGRFSWIFYYIFTIFAAFFYYQFFRLLKEKGLKPYAMLMLFLVISFWTIDMAENIRLSTKNLLNANDKFKASYRYHYHSILEKAQLEPEDFQAILFFPFVNTCGDKLYFDKSKAGFDEAMKCSYLTGIPLIQSYSPRLSFTHAFSSIQMLADSALRKSRLDDMNDKPLLLVCADEKLTEREKWLKSESKVFYRQKNFCLATLPVEVFTKAHQNWKEYATKVKNKIDCTTDVCTDNDSVRIVYKDFNNKTSKINFTGNGALYQEEGKAQLFSGPLSFNGKAELSFWMYIDTRTDNMPDAIFHTRNKAGEKIQAQKLETRAVHDVYNQWVRISTQFQAEPDNTYELFTTGKYITVDNLIIRPVETNVFIKSNPFDLFNNFPCRQ